jgi:hypothetical protein
MLSITFIFGIVLFAVAFYFILKVLKNIILGAMAIFVLLLAYTFIFGSTPEVCTMPMIGKIISPICNFTYNTTAISTAVKKVFYGIDIIATSRDNQNNLLVVVSNTGTFDQANIQVFVDNSTVKMTNKFKDPLKPGETTVIHTNFNSSCSTVFVKTNQTSSKTFNC